MKNSIIAKMFLTKHCSICLKSKKALLNIGDPGVDNVSYVTKLQFIVPEVQWNYNHLICFLCVEQLNSTYTFKELCLKSFNLEVKAEDNASDRNTFSEKLLLIKSDNTVVEFTEVSAAINNAVGETNQNLDTSHVGQSTSVIENADKTKNTYDLDDRPFEDDFYQDTPSPASIDQDVKTTQIPEEKKFSCVDCGKFFKTLSTLKSHALSLHTDRSEWINDCYACDKVFARKSTLVAHIKTKHLEKGKFDCLNCSESFNQKHLLVFHMRDIHVKSEGDGKTGRTPRQKRSFSCNICDKVFTVRNDLFDHAKKEHNVEKKDVRPYKCDVCDKRFKVSTYLLSHKLYHEGKRTNICNVCGKGFITLKDLKIHETYHTNIFTYCCPDCGQTFKNHKLLYAHKISKHVAPEDWKFCCNICQKRFPRVSGYKMHMRRHMGDKRFLCHLCDKKFVSKFQLLRHVESHSNVKRFHCDICGRDYREKRILNIHLFDVHGIGESTGEKKLCHICSMAFSCNYKLRRHILKHSKPYGCMMCEKRYPDNYHLKQHLQKKHKIEEKDLEVVLGKIEETSLSNRTKVELVDKDINEEKLVSPL